MNPNKRTKILEKVRSGRASRKDRLILKQEGLCFYCHTDLEKDITKEHLEAKALGGSNDLFNLRAAHMLCNGIVGTLPVELKLELHEIGRDKGPDAFWAKAREYQQRYGEDKNAYRRLGGTLEQARRKALGNAARQNVAPREVTPEEVEVELRKLNLAIPKAQRGAVVQEEVERRKQTGWTSLGLVGWYRLMEQRGWPMGCSYNSNLPDEGSTEVA